jgi:hypothetical protein
MTSTHLHSKQGETIMKIRYILVVLSLLIVVLATGCQPAPPVAPSDITFSGPSSGMTGTTYNFAVSTAPVTATQPIKFTWQVEGQPAVENTGNVTSTASFSWPTSGPQKITVTAENSAGKVTKVFDFTVETPLSQDPLEAIQTIAEQQKDVKTQHMDMTVALNLKMDNLTGDLEQMGAFLKNFKANLNLSGDVDSEKEDVSLNGELDLGALTTLVTQGEEKLLFEVRNVGDKTYTKVNVGDQANEWQEQKDMTSSSSTPPENPLKPEQLAELLKKASKAEKLADEKIDGVDTHHYKVTMDPAALIDAIAELAKTTDASATVDEEQLAQAKQLLKDAIFEVDMWAGKQDLLLRQIKVHFNVDLKDAPEMQGATALIDLLVTNKSSKFNEPVTITAPK